MVEALLQSSHCCAFIIIIADRYEIIEIETKTTFNGGGEWMISSGFLILTMEKPFIVLITMNYSKYEPSLWNWLKIHTTIAYSMEYLNQKQLVVHLFAGQKIRNKTKNIERGWLVRGLKGRNVVDSEHDSVMLLFLFSVQYCHGFAGFLECDDSHARTFRLDICAFNHR